MQSNNRILEKPEPVHCNAGFAERKFRDRFARQCKKKSIASAKHKLTTLQNGLTTTRSPVLVHWASAQLREEVGLGGSSFQRLQWLIW